MARCFCYRRISNDYFGNSTLITGQYGLHDVTLSTPCIVGGGVESLIELRLNKSEEKALEASAAVLQQVYAALKSR